MIANLVLSWRIYIRKSMVYWPLAIVPVAYYFISPVYAFPLFSLLQKHSKKLFDMCNLGEDFYLGQKRNEVLRECNKILDVEDFWFLYLNQSITMTNFVKKCQKKITKSIIQFDMNLFKQKSFLLVNNNEFQRITLDPIQFPMSSRFYFWNFWNIFSAIYDDFLSSRSICNYFTKDFLIIFEDCHFNWLKLYFYFDNYLFFNIFIDISFTKVNNFYFIEFGDSQLLNIYILNTKRIIRQFTMKSRRVKTVPNLILPFLEIVLNFRMIFHIIDGILSQTDFILERLEQITSIFNTVVIITTIRTYIVNSSLVLV